MASCPKDLAGGQPSTSTGLLTKRGYTNVYIGIESVVCGGLKTSATDTIKPKGLTLKDLKWKFLYNQVTLMT
jgi:hypothetical protein